MKAPFWPTNLEQTKINLGLNNIKNVLKFLNNPEKKIKNIIHVAGTNGKGSTCAFIASILQESGYTVNLFTSPHLIDFNERFKIHGEIISDNILNETINNIKNSIDSKVDVSYFEASVLFAIELFNKYPADFNIFEVGLGGRLDATNIFDSKLASIITKISHDHHDFLGNTLEKIAFEKAGIIQNNDNVFTIEQEKNILEVFQKQVDYKNSILQIIKPDINSKIKLNLLGTHQIENFSLARFVCDYIKKQGFNISEQAIINGANNVKHKGRIEHVTLYGLENVIIDCAHNEDGIRVFCNYVIEHFKQSESIAIFASLDNKNIDKNYDILAKTFDKIYLPYANRYCFNKEFKSPEELAKKFEIFQINYEIVENILNINEKNKQIFIFGSMYFLGGILDKFEIEN